MPNYAINHIIWGPPTLQWLDNKTDNSVKINLIWLYCTTISFDHNRLSSGGFWINK
jgi:hypothetical protein